MTEQTVAGYRLSPAQRQLWALQRGPHEAAFHAALKVVVEGPLSAGDVKAGLGRVADRHEILRTRFRVLPGMNLPLQMIAGDQPDFRVEDLSGLDEARRLAREEALWTDFAGRPFDTNGSPLQALLIQRSNRAHLLMLRLPSICSDRKGLQLLLLELASEVAGMGAAIEEPLQFADVAQWLNDMLVSEDTEKGRRYWRNRDFSILSRQRLNLETNGESFRPGTLRMRPAIRLDGLRRRAHGLGCSPESLAAVCWYRVLRRLGAPRGLVLGMAHSGRKFDDLNEVLGCLESFLPVSIDCDGGLGLGEWVNALESAYREVSSWQEFFDWNGLAERSAVKGMPRCFPFVFEWVDWPEPIAIGTVALRVLASHVRREPNRLGLTCVARNGVLKLVFHFDGAAFTEKEVALIGSQLETLLNQVVENGDLPMARYSGLAEPERARLLYSLNATAVSWPDRWVPQWFLETAARAADTPALIMPGGRALTFGVLADRVSAMALELRHRGVTAETMVAVCMARGPEMVCAIMAILVAGGAFVPIDTTYPEGRIAFILSDARVSLLVTQTQISEKLPETPIPKLFLDPGTSPPFNRPRHIAASFWPEQAAYTIYTSGSTGKPKGVVIAHGAFANYLRWCTGAFGFDSGNGAPLHGSIGFDATLTSLFAPLLTGKTLFLLPDGDPPEAFSEFVTGHRQASMIKLTPAHLDLLAMVPGTGEANPTHVFVVGGEALQGRHLRHWQMLLGRSRWYNEYGPTETVVGCAAYLIEPADVNSVEVPIGRPVANTALFVLDRFLQPVPAGVEGELWIGGAGVARGYLGRPGLTAEKFLPDPFGRAGRRVYRTVDLVFLRGDDNLVFRGRCDQQIKLRGFRIEPGEVEAVLDTLPEVVQAAVVARSDEREEAYLAAYLVMAEGSSLDPAQLRAAVSEVLPFFMVPSAFVRLKRIPVTANGKLDRGSLPKPDFGAFLSRDYRAPRDPGERQLSEIWQEVLELERVGVNDNFFAIGGHSLRAIRVVSRVRKLFGVALSVRDLFQYPTVAELAAVIAASDASAEEPIPRREPGTVPPLTYDQQRLWFFNRLEGPSPTYNMPIALDLKGPLDVQAMAASIQAIADRHEVLRTAFPQREGNAVQEIRTRMVLPFSLVCLRAIAGERAETAMRLLVQQGVAFHFDLSLGPLAWVRLFRFGDDRHVFQINMHHIVSDGWSLHIFVREFGAFYRAFYRGTRPELPELAIQYGDFACWQQRNADRMAEELAFWKRELAGAPELLKLPTDRPRPRQQTFKGASRGRSMGGDILGSRLDAFCKAEGVTLFMTLLAVFQLLLARYTGQKDVVVGTPIANRDRPELEPLIGLFVNTLALRARFQERLSFREFAVQVKQTALAAYRHKTAPFEQQVGALNLERNAGYAPLVQVRFMLEQAYGAATVPLPGIVLSAAPQETGFTKLDLMLTVLDRDSDLLVNVTYNTDLFDASTIDRFIGHYENLLHAVMEDADRTSIPLLSEAERAGLLYEWNEDRAPAYDDPIYRWFERTAQRHGENEAVCFRETTETGEKRERAWSYAELNARANRLARFLAGNGIGPEDMVGLCFHRSPEMILALLAVFKAGAAFIPLDPDHPLERKAYIVRDAGLTTVLCKGGIGDPAGLDGLDPVDLETIGPAIEKGKPDNLARTPEPANLAYAIYTSGSSGRPKGVLVTHRGLGNLVRQQGRVFRCREKSRVLQFAPLSFDAAVCEIMFCWHSGATLCMAPKKETMPGKPLETVLRDLAITHVTLPPSALAVTNPDGLDGLTHLVVAGEACAPEDYRRWSRNRAFFNAYGPTETSICATIKPCGEGLERLPIGRPLANTQAYVLDERFELAPVGVMGQLVLGGVHLARGYLGLPALTADRFSPHPFSRFPGTRLYRTGDIARFLPDGELEFLGRMDRQVKLRGFRIELGEIEETLLEHPEVALAAAAIRADKRGEPILAAYLELVAGKEPVPDGLLELGFTPRDEGTGEEPQETITVGDDPARALREFLIRRLPEYMIPATFVVLERLPLNASGKIDRKALPEPAGEDRVQGPYVAPGNEREEVLAEICADLLGVERVGVTEDFFDLGGHSLMAIRLLSKAGERFGVDLDLGRFFEEPTVAFLAKLMETAPATSLPALKAVQRPENVPLSFAQERLWAIGQIEGANPSYNVPVFLNLEGRLDEPALLEAFRQLVARHEILRTTFAEVDNQPVQVVRDGSEPAIRIHDLRDRPSSEREAEVARLVGEEARYIFDFTAAPPFRVSLLRLEPETHVLLINMHHIVSDGWSMGVITRELGILYHALSRGKAPVLDPLPVQYADYACWQRFHMKEKMAGQLAYWKKLLRGVPPVKLPLDRPRAPVRPQAAAGSIRFQLPRETGDRLERLAHDRGATLFMVLTAAFQLTLAFHERQEDVMIGTDVANRNRAETENLIGFFINQIVVRGDLSGNPEFLDFVGRLRGQILESYANQDLPFQTLVRELVENPDRSRTPLFDVKLILQNQPMGEADIPGIRLSMIPPGNNVATFDLLLQMLERPDGLVGALQYSTALFEESTITHLLDRFRKVLESVAIQPAQTRDALWSMLAAADRQRATTEKEKFREARKSMFAKFKKK